MAKKLLPDDLRAQIAPLMPVPPRAPDLETASHGFAVLPTTCPDFRRVPCAMELPGLFGKARETEEVLGTRMAHENRRNEQYTEIIENFW